VLLIVVVCEMGEVIEIFKLYVVDIHCKLSTSGVRYIDVLISHGTHTNLVMLLSANDLGLLHWVLRLFISLSR